MKHILLAALLGLAAWSCQAADAPAVEKTLSKTQVNDWLTPWIRHPQFLNLKIAPRGDYLAAAVMATEDTGALVVLRRSDMTLTANVRVRGRVTINNFYWANDERLIFTVAEAEGSIGRPQPTGELYAVDYNGKNLIMLAGPRKDTSGQVGGNKDIVGAELIDTLRDDDKFILVSMFRLTAGEAQYPTIEKLNINSGARTLLAKAPVLNATYLTDRQNQVRFAAGTGTDNKHKLYYRAKNDADWEVINDEHESGVDIKPLGFNADGSKAYLQSEEEKGPDGIYEFDTQTKKRELLARDETVDPLTMLRTHDNVQAFGVVYMDGGPKVAFLDSSVPEAKMLKALMSSFPGEYVRPTSYTTDGKEMVFVVYSDTNPGRFYVLGKDGKATYALGTSDWLKADMLAEMKPIEYTARDGLKIHGYLTVPRGSDGKNLPLILHPHGGPFGPFDDWGFDRDVQLLASRGYAVLQVNFRGSGNYGRSFQRMGFQQWGGTMQDDLTDATLWAIQEGIANKDRICIYGASYGGYASAMAIAKEPDLYKCAVGYVGVYDMGMMYSRGDIQERNSGVNFLKEALGTGSDKLGAASPTKLVDRMKAPIFIVAGGEDVRAHPDHSRALRDALEKAGKHPEWMLAPHEGHGFYREDVNRELYTRMIAFFDKYIGPDAAKN